MNTRNFSIFAAIAVIALPIAAWAAYTAPTGAPTTGNPPGPVWLSPSSAQTGNINLTGSASIGSASITGSTTIGQDVYLSSGRAIRLDAANSGSILNIGNWAVGSTGTNAMVYGDIYAKGYSGTANAGTVNTFRLCLNNGATPATDCKSSWPAGGTMGGTGTANYLPKFSGSTTLGNSNIINAGTVLQILNADLTVGAEIRPGGSGLNNTYFGRGVGGTNTSGSVNTGLGSLALSSITTGAGNTAIGEEALFLNTAGAENTAVGIKAMQVTQGSYNVALGAVAMWGNTSGQRNTALGYGALSDNTTGSDNTTVGYNAEVASGLTNAAAIGSGSLASISNSMILGNGVKVGIGTSSPSGKLSVAGAGGSAANAGIEFYSGPGNATGYSGWAGRIYSDTPTGGWGTNPFVISVPNTAGTEVKTLTLLNGNVGVGASNPAYKLDVNGDIITNWMRTRGATGWYNETYAGGWYMTDTSWIRTYNARNVWTAGGLLGSDGGLTVGYGGAAPSAGGAIIAGDVAIGTSVAATRLDVLAAAGGTAVRGSTASAGGYGVTGVNTAGSVGGTGVYGSCVGGNCSGVHGYTSGGGQGVYGVGVSTGVRGEGTNGVVGTSPAFSGAGVYGNNTSGSGPGVQGDNMNGGGSGVIGNGGMYGVQGNSAGYGVYGYSAGGRGVYGSGGTYGVQANSNYAGIYSYGNSYSFYGGGGNFYNAGRMSIGTTAAAVPLTVVADGSIYAQLWAQSNDVNCGYAATAYTDGNFYLNRWCSGASASAYLTPAGAWVQYSDRDLKEDIKVLSYGIDDVMKLKPVTYTRKDDKENKELIGFIAQDVQKVVPELVSGKAISEGGTGLGLNYQNMTAVLTSAIQDQQKEIETLKAQNEDLLKRLEAIEAKLK